MTAGIVIVGAGYCGVNAAMAARDAEYGGPITLIGDEANWPCERPPLSKWDESGPVERGLFAPEIYSQKDILLRRGDTAAAIMTDQKCVQMQSGDTIAYDKLLLATGARARRIDPLIWPSIDLLYLRTLADAQALSGQIRPGEDVLIIGGGFIGLELAASLVTRRAFVHVVEAQERVLARAVPREISRAVEALHVDRGVTIHTGATIVSLEDRMAELSSGQSVRADHVIAGIGSVPNTGLAEAAGLAVEDGIVVNSRFVTSEPHVFAAGDCCSSPVMGSGRRRLESWQVAGDQGRLAGQVMAGAEPESLPTLWFWSDQYDHGLQVVGLPGSGSSRVLRHLSEDALICIDLMANRRIASAAGFAPGNVIGRDMKLIQKILEAGLPVRSDMLADPGTSLKSVLRAG